MGLPLPLKEIFMFCTYFFLSACSALLSVSISMDQGRAGCDPCAVSASSASSISFFLVTSINTGSPVSLFRIMNKSSCVKPVAGSYWLETWKPLLENITLASCVVIRSPSFRGSDAAFLAECFSCQKRGADKQKN